MIGMIGRIVRMYARVWTNDPKVRPRDWLRM